MNRESRITMHKVLAKMWSQAGEHDLAAQHIDKLADLAANPPHDAAQETKT